MTRGTTTGPRVAVVAPAEDLHAQAVTAVLRDRHGIEAVTLDTRRFPDVAGGFRLGGTRCARTFADVALDDVTAVWWRRPRPSSVPTGLNPDDDTYRQAECDAFVQGLLWSMPALWVNDPAADRVAQRKLVQLRHAAEVGLAVPETLITNSPDEASAFVAGRPGRVVFKRTGTSRSEFSETRIVEQQHLRRLSTITASPTTFQDYVEPEADLRIVWVAGHALTVHIDSAAGTGRVDSRLDNSVAFTQVTLPVAVETALGELMSRLGLLFGVIDMRLDRDGVHWFLEVNPQGQFAYLEIKTRIPMFAAVADLLATGTSQPATSRTLSSVLPNIVFAESGGGAAPPVTASPKRLE